MDKKDSHILWFDEISIADVPLVGGKNASLGEMYSSLSPLGIKIPNGFAVTAAGYRHFLEKAKLKEKLADILSDLDAKDIKNLQERGQKARSLILSAKIPDDLAEEIAKAYQLLCEKYQTGKLDVAVRSSATAEDLPGASFAGQQESFLNIRGKNGVLSATKKCVASLFTNRAISYRVDKGFSHFDVSLSVGIQKMVRSDLASSGVIFTLDTESGFDKVVVINGIYGLGEYIVQGKVKPEEYIVFKPGLKEGHKAIIERSLGLKDKKLVYSFFGTRSKKVSPSDQKQYTLTDDEVINLAKWSVSIEEHFSQKHNRYQPMDIEWAKDGKSGELFIIQARPETIHSSQDKTIYNEYHLSQTGKVLIEGIAVGAKIGTGKVRVIPEAKKIGQFQKGEVLATKVTDPDWEPIMKIASAIVTDQGGRTSHAAIVSRELGIPCIVGSGRATQILKTNQEVTVDCSTGAGRVYEKILKFDLKVHHLGDLPKTKTKVMVNIGSPNEAFANHYLPVQGVGLGRLEFIIASMIKVHPQALLDYPHKLAEKIGSSNHHLLREIEELTVGYPDKKEYYVDVMASGIAKIGAAFWPNPVIIRFSDFKTNEYRTLLGGDLYEPHEENPMIGWRGASRYYNENFSHPFSLECKAIAKVRYDWGLTNVVPMVPFCRTPEEGQKVVKIMEENGLDRKKDKKLSVYVMCEIPSNVLLAKDFLEIFDGMSIGSNDLSQLVLGMDRDSTIVASIANENNEAVKTMISEVVKICRVAKKYIGICGQAPSDYPDFAKFLVDLKIDSISLNPDVVIKTLGIINKAENR